MDMMDVMIQGTMKAAVEIAHRRNIDRNVILSQAFVENLRAEIKDGYFKAVEEANEAMQAVGEAWARESLNASCLEFAIRAFDKTRNCGQAVQL